MSTIHFDYDMKKAIEVILYLANRLDNSDFMTVAKLIYFADKTSLERYGRLLFGETYVAMEKGPVPSKAYDLMKAGKDHQNYGFIVENKWQLKPLREADDDYLSESDMACLDLVIHAYGHLPGWDLSAKSHDEAWRQAWEASGKMGSYPMPIESIARLFDDSEELLDYLHNGNDE